MRAYTAWIEASKITKGAIFRPIDRHGNVGPNAIDPGSVSRMIKAAAQRAGLDHTTFSGHSLRSGLATVAAEADVPEVDIMARERIE